MTKHVIDAAIDDTSTSYAYAWLERSHGYGHMNVNIRFAGPGYNRPGGCIKVTCQIGSGYEDSEQAHTIYCEKYGFDQDMGNGSLEDLENAIKVMRRIKKHLGKMYDTYGNAKSYAEYCQRILMGAGVKKLIADRDGFTRTSGMMRDKHMSNVGSQSLEALENMQSHLLAAFPKRRAA